MKKFYTLFLCVLITVFSYGQSANDACAGAPLVLDNGSCNAGSIIAPDADNLTGEAGCATPGGPNDHKDVWYRFVATNGGVNYSITATGASSLTNVEFILMTSTGPCAGLTVVGSACGVPPLTGNIGGITPGTTCYYIISSPNNAVGNFTTCLTTIPPPANDVKCGAVALTPNGSSVCATNAGGTSTGDGTGSCFTTENGLWYKVTVATVPSVLGATADFAGTNFDAQIAIFSSSTNSCTGVFTELACDDNSGSGTNPVATTPLTVAGTYFILIDGFAGATGNFCIAATLQTCTDGIQNQNESGVDCGGVCTACAGVTGYLQPIAGLQNANVGTCMVNTCSGNYLDDGGSGANYSAGIPYVYRTFCPSTAGQCLRATFSSFSTNGALSMGSNCSLFTVLNGPTQNSASLGSFAGTGAIGPFTSTDKSGCLGFRFTSLAACATFPGWVSALTCVPCATAAPTSGGPNATDNNDCTNAIVVCANTALTGASTGPGLTSDGCSGCNISENFTSWYKINVTTSGTMAMVITPSGAIDYDFALYQASSCAALGTPVRCSYAATTGTTGMNAAAIDFSEDVTGDARVDSMRITAGDVYYLLVNKWDAGGAGFAIDWGLTNGASIACPVILPIELLSFDAVYNGKNVDVTWATASEFNNDYFIVERSEDGINFKNVGKVDSKGIDGRSNSNLRYSLNDPAVKTGVYYYRLKQVDFDLTTKTSEIVAVTIVNDNDVFAIKPNPTFNSAEVSYYCYSTENALLRVYDNTGRLLSEKEISCSKGQNKSNINLDSEADGLYIITLTTSNKVYKTKLVKQSNLHQ